MESISTLLNRLKGLITKEDIEEPQFRCKICKDKGVFPVMHNGCVTMAICKECEREIKLKRWLEHSGISPEDYGRYTMENFKADTKEACEMKKIAKNFISDPNATGLAFFGKSGTGKTHICVAVCKNLNLEHHYWQYRSEIQKLKNVMYRDPSKYDELMQLPKSSPCLYIDDLFKGAFDGSGKLSGQDGQLMFEIINARYIKKLPTIISSEYSLNEIIKADTAIGSRIYEMVYPYLLKVAGDNRRIVNGRK